MQFEALKKYWFNIISGILLFSLSVTAKDIHVYPDQPTGIQAAFNQSASGDRILLHQGEYYEILTLLDKSELLIVAAGDGPVRIFGVMKEFTTSSNKLWRFIRKEQNPHFVNEQWIYEATIPLTYQNINNELPDYWIYRNNFYWSENEMLWSYTDLKSFQNRTVLGTLGEGVLFGKNKITIAINRSIENFPKTQYATYSGRVLRTGNLTNVVIDGGPKKQIEFVYAGRYCITGGGSFHNVTFRNLKFTNPNDAFYFIQSGGKKVVIEHCFLKKNIPFDCLWSDIKHSTTMQGSGIVYANGTVGEFVIRNNIVEGFFNGIVALPGYTTIENNYLKNIGDDAIELDGPAENTIVRGNTIENCFVSFSLVPVEKGPVYIYDNLIYSNIESFPFQYEKDGSIRYIGPRLIKFWNLTNGTKRKDGKMMKVSGNVHFYYNTFISKKTPFTVGNYGKKEYSPVESTFYNNIFVSEGGLTYSTGFSEDGIDVDNNVFYSSFKDQSEDRLFIGWNGPNHNKTLQNNAQWSDNQFLKLKYEFKKGKFHWCRKSQKALSKVPYKKLPSNYPGAEKLNNRDYPGAFIKK